MSECNHDCGSCGESCSERTPGSMLAKLHEGSTVKKVIGVVSGKGGVGKSMVTSQLAVTMQRRGYRTAVLDADITGPSIPKAFGLTEKAGGTESALFPVETKTGIQVMSINLLLENDTDPVLWRGPIIGSVVTQFWTDVLWDNVDYMFVDMPPGTGDVALSTFPPTEVASFFSFNKAANAWNTSAHQRSPSLKLGAPAGMIINSCTSTVFAA